MLTPCFGIGGLSGGLGPRPGGLSQKNPLKVVRTILTGGVGGRRGCLRIKLGGGALQPVRLQPSVLRIRRRLPLAAVAAPHPLDQPSCTGGSRHTFCQSRRRGMRRRGTDTGGACCRALGGRPHPDWGSESGVGSSSSSSSAVAGSSAPPPSSNSSRFRSTCSSEASGPEGGGTRGCELGRVWHLFV